MEITDVSMISDFQAGVNCLQNPSIISRLFTLLGMELWKWSAIIIAVFASFKRLKVLFIRFRGTVAPSLEKIVDQFVEDFELSDDDDDDDDEDDDECSSVSTLEDFSEEEEDYRVAGRDYFIKEKGQNGNQLRVGRKLSWIDFSTDSSVVKLWDGFEESYRNIVSIWDSKTIFDYQVSAANLVAQPPTVTLTAEVYSKRNGVVLNAYDRRMRGEKPVVIADWAQFGVDQKANVTNGVLTVGDFRNTKTPLKTIKLRRSNGDEFVNGE